MSQASIENRSVFISYVEEDGALVRALAQQLRGLGHSTWIYEEDGIGGISYLEQVLGAIDGCQAFILLASEKSVRSRQVIKEVEHAYEAEKLIIPVRVNLTHQQFMASSAILRMACGTAVTLAASTDPSVIARDIVRTLRFATNVHESVERQETKPALSNHGAAEHLENKQPNSVTHQRGRLNEQATSRIFVTYRREDAEGAILALMSPLRQRFGDRIFIQNTDNIAPGEDFVEVINRELESCSVLLVVIGKEWVTARDSRANRCLDNPHDYLRLEIAAALKKKNLLVIPVLVGQADMPKPDDLPPDLKPLFRRNAIELSAAWWDRDIMRLVESIERACGRL
jgi:hypothetical protein